MGWVPFDDAWWPGIVEVLPLPWPVEAVAFDLRWQVDRERRTGQRRLGRPLLCRRYGWTDRQVRTYLASGVWEDGTGVQVQLVSSQRPGGVQEASRKRAEDEPATEEERPARVQPASRRRPASVPARDTTHRSTSTSTTTRSDFALPEGTPGTDDDPPAFRLWWRYKGRHTSLDPKKGHGRRLLKAEERVQLEGLLLLLDWLKDCKVPGSRAAFLRESGHDTPETLFSDKLETYMDMARRWQEHGRPGKAVRGIRPHQESNDDMTPQEQEEYQRWVQATRSSGKPPTT